MAPEMRYLRRMLRLLRLRPGEDVVLAENLVPESGRPVRPRWLLVRIPIADDVDWLELCERVWYGRKRKRNG